MSEIDSGGPSFPMSHEQKLTGVWGLTKREWFAGMALQGILSNNSINIHKSNVVVVAYGFADIMIRAGKGEK